MMKQLLFFILFSPSFLFSQQIKYVDFKTVDAIISVNPIEKSVSGSVNYTFEVLSKIDTIRIDAKNMNFEKIKINNKICNFKNSTKELLLFEGFKKGENTVSFNYKATPKQTMYFVGEGENMQIWTQGQGKYTSHWFPSFDDMNEKVIFNMTIISDKKYEVVSNGLYSPIDNRTGNQFSFNSNGTDKVSFFSMKKPMSSYLLMLAIGKFEKQTLTSASGTPLENYISPEDVSKFEPTYRYTKQIFDFFEKEIGVNYPWEIYRQIPAKDFLYGGMENTTSTIFSQYYVVDETGFNDLTYINVNAHELAHQWFGDMITATSGKHHWLQEGFATYYALLAEKELFGEDHFNWEMYEIAERLQQASKTDTIPILNEKASSLSFYQKGAWALHVLRENVGHKDFQKAVKNYLKKYGFKNVNTDDFLSEINKVSKYDTKKFQQVWLESPVFQVKEAMAILNKNKFIQKYFEVSELKDVPFAEKRNQIEILLKSDVFYPIKEEIIYQLQDLSYEEKADFLKIAMQTKDFKTRQAIAKTMRKVPVDFKAEYETLLDDDSYITKEIAMNVYFSEFPENQKWLLDKTKTWVGFNDKNLRVLWLTLALRAKDYQQESKVQFYEELLQYASPNYESTLRQNALTKLLYLDKNDINPMKFLVNGLVSHRWQFSKYARDNIRALLKSDRHRTYFASIIPELPENEQFQLNRLLNEKI
ncbi:aminopeptidase N [Flavobacterium arsenatis]|uniref:Aminopeptidase N n=1 Tax=Flavobacterium arsenatis TaxID=1484332 RepID=A0ABU1TPT8_9FLAO|nr:M1 family metallopeptidase [Flavobacterium arsenatis]MDR6967433.1 aminopeptidase N [Flavobacterium arsenatis]